MSSLGDMQVPDGWSSVSLGEIGKFSKGKGISKKDTTPTGLPCIRYAEIYTDHDFVIKKFKSFIPPEYIGKTKQLSTNDLIFAGSGETVEDIGKSVAFIGDEEAYVGGDAVILSPTIEYDSLFISYQLNDDVSRIQLRKYGQGSSVIHIYSSELKKVIIPLPPLPEQKKIASILSSVDDVIEKTEAQISKLQDLKKGMMTELLTKGIGHTEFKNSPVGRIPVSWEVLLGSKFVKLGSGVSPSQVSFQENGSLMFMKVDDFNHQQNRNKIIVTKLHFHKNGNENVPVYPSGTIIIAKRGAAIFKNRVKQLGYDSSIDTNLMTINTNSLCLEGFLKNYLKFIELGKIADTTSIPQINNFHLYEMIFPVPPLPEQKEIASILTSVDNNIESKQRKLTHIKSLKKGLMNDLLTGKVRVDTTSTTN